VSCPGLRVAPARLSGPLAEWDVSSRRGGRLRRWTRGAGIASVAIAAMTGVCAGANPASADDGSVCPPGDAQWLRILFVGEGFSSPLRARILEQLGAALRRHELIVCDPAVSDRGHGAGPPLAEIGLALTPDVVLSVNVRDAVTDKNLA